MTSKKIQVAPGVGIWKVVIGALIGLALGYYMLNHVATWENPFLGNTFHIVFGCIFIAASAIALLVVLKLKYFPKKKKKGSRPVFLDPDQKRSSRRRSN